MSRNEQIRKHAEQATRANNVWDKQDAGRTLTNADRRVYAEAKAAADAIKTELAATGYNVEALDQIAKI